jgi:lipid II:glycine glycyltransferase (peptidoglycan interpeptide bridge formation enzyme)
VLGNHRWLEHVEIIKSNEVVNIDLSFPEEMIWTQSYDREVRRIINKGKEMGYRDRTVMLSEASDKDMQDFRSIYFSTLDRNTADSFYYFTENYFNLLKQKMAGNILLSIIYLDNQPIGASLNPFLGIMGYGLLGGSLREYRKISPFTYMIHKVALKLKELGIRNYLLGGGSTPGDGIFKYKNSFAVRGVRDFFIGLRVYNQAIYDSLCEAWEARYPEKRLKYGRYFLKYRY